MSEKTIRSRAWWQYEDDMTAGSAEDYFPFFDGKKHIISLVGGGGKSTLLEYLAACFAARSMRAAIMTSTRMACPEHVSGSIEECRARWAQGKYAACGERTENGKFRAPDDLLLRALTEEADALIIEADGAHMLACKAPAEHEPVILSESDIVIGVMGSEVLGRRVGEVCFRPERVCDVLGCDEDHHLTAGDLATLLLSERGARKGVGDRKYYIVINKCDNEQRIQNGIEIARILRMHGHENTVLTCHK